MAGTSVGPFPHAWRLILPAFLLLLLLPALVSCKGEVEAGDLPVLPRPVLKVGGIPDQDAARLARRYQEFTAYLSRELDVKVEYVPSLDYAAVVTAFGQGELQLAFLGGFTGVQARLQDPEARAIAQREHDAQFHSRFIVRSELEIDSLEDLKAQASYRTLTFGSESSTSGHLMPRHFLLQAGIDPDTDFRSLPNFAGSHDLTWQLVESGAFDVGALNEDVWERAVREGRVDPSQVREFYTTPAFFDYNWTASGELDRIYGDGFTGRVQRALLRLNQEQHRDILDLFSTERFVTTDNRNYRDLEAVARELAMVQ